MGRLTMKHPLYSTNGELVSMKYRGFVPNLQSVIITVSTNEM